MRIAMIGSGYVGLVSGACFADFGHRVTCVDKDVAKVDSLTRGVMPIYERDLEDLVMRNLREGRLTFTTALAEAVRDAEAVFIAVVRLRAGATAMPISLTSTPHHAKLRPQSTVLRSSSRSRPCRSAPAMKSNSLSAMPVRMQILPWFSNPEFLREGSAIQDFKHPDRIVSAPTMPAPTPSWRNFTGRSISMLHRSSM